MKLKSDRYQLSLLCHLKQNIKLTKNELKGNHHHDKSGLV